MDKVPIIFEHKGKQYSGEFCKVAGGGSSSLFHLSVDNYHWGQLFYTQWGWQFYSNSDPELNELSEFFGGYITAWYQ